MAMPSERSLANLVKFKPGQSGNPSGRSKAQHAFESEFRAAAQAGDAAKLYGILMTHAQSDDGKVAIAACRELLDRLAGKALQSVELSAGEEMTAEERAEKVVQIIAGALGRGGQSGEGK